MVVTSVCWWRTWLEYEESRGSATGRLWAFSRWPCDQSGPRDRSISLVTTRSSSFRLDRAPSRAMMGSEPGSSRSSSRKVRRGTYSGPLARRVIDHASSPSSSRRGSSRSDTSWMRAWG